jgi:exo-beta-1,3-glucanase (GH17 family)
MSETIAAGGNAGNRLAAEHGNAICYSGYRDGQTPRLGLYPTYEQVREDLLILARNWKYLRLYDSSRHAELVLDVIEREGLDFEVMLGAELAAELNNPNCPWGGEFDEQTLAANRRHNDEEADRAIALAGRYPNVVFAVAVGNEAAVEWTDHLVPVERLVSLVKRVKGSVSQPVTSCDNYVPWMHKLDPVVEEVDFISIHTYPVWEYRSIDDALDFSKDNYSAVADRHSGKPVIITEAGWTTASNGRGIEPTNASEELQALYYQQLLDWTASEKILAFVFEAFDEPWKGSSDPLEPEKHWGLFTVDRKPKRVMRAHYDGLLD